ncbi:hypothetical protein O181_034776 [Austropuccinia psidii MF-1]|uniref:Rieske domain-containing protein n=1 Tax=Austropuccinia psidii MF-1 TaxID=1389203 RepID=A0A9Q3D1E5_9BASI|nr:hypothetical protein [Austropuccinia psidii MF-1]
MILIGQLDQLNLHSRYIVSVRSDSLGSKYHSIIIYATDHDQPSSPSHHKDLNPTSARQWHAMEEECPHLGASMADAQIQIEDDGLVAICPWHNYDFNLRTGQSSSGLKACVFPTLTKDGKLYLDYPSGATDWSLVALRPVSQRFALPHLDSESLSTSISSLDRPPPKSLLEWGAIILRTPSPELKIQFTRHAFQSFRKGQLAIFPSSATPSGFSLPPDQPTREAVQLVKPGDVLKRGKGGSVASRIKLLHALANIELWAIDLAWDIITRFAHELVGGKKLPRAFFTDFAKVAEDEAKHFTLLREALKRLGSDWGQLPIHDGLWQSARDTAHSLTSRICIIHLVHEARGLDVNPTQIKRVRDAGDHETASSLEIIHADEVTHVAAGHRWLCYICNTSEPKLDPVNVFRSQVKDHFFGKLKPPFNAADRAKAGLSPSFYEDL